MDRPKLSEWVAEPDAGCGGGEVAVFSLGNVGLAQMESQLPTKVYQLARTLDFNSRHTCANLPPGINVVYIGPDQGKVLVDPSAEPVLTFAEFVGRPASQWERPPQEFLEVECLPQVRQ